MNYIITSGFWPRVRARALRAPVFLGSLSRQTAHGSFAASYSTPKNIYNLSNLGRPRKGLFSFLWTKEAMKYEVPWPPPIAISLIRPAIFFGSNYVLMRAYAVIFPVSFYFFNRFLSFLFVILFFFSLLLLILLFLSLLILLFLYFNCSSYNRHSCILMIYTHIRNSEGFFVGPSLF
jgi:hypothetical protein